MESIYQSHFGLTGEPFNNTPDAQFLYRSPSHSEALAHLIYGVDARKGFVVLTGEVGTGKTLLIHTMLKELDRNTKTALIFNTVVNGKDLLRYVCEEFELITAREEAKEVHYYLALINQFLFYSYKKGENVALIIDEAQNLPAEVLESIRLLSNFETPQDKLLQIVLAGQPELITRLNSPALRQLKQRVVLRHHLKPLSSAECAEYINRRLEVVGGGSSMFDSEAIEIIYSYSGGIPRLINILCDNGLLTAYALRKKIVEGELIREVGHDLHLSPPFREFGGVRKENGRTEERSNFSFLNVRRKTAVEEMPVQQNGSAQVSTKNESVLSGFGRNEPATVQGNGKEREEEAGFHRSGLADRVPVRFFDRMINELTDAMGPMARFVVYDHIARLGESPEAFPQLRLAELIESTSQEIFSENLKSRFRNLLREEIHAIDSASAMKGWG
jgi:general secretion pathway protein A